MPSKFRTSLRVSANLSAAASTTSANVVFAANNLNDPLLSSGSSKPVGYTQLAALYNRYRVLGSKIEMICAMSTTITTGTAQISGAVCIAPSNTGLGRTLFADAISQPFAKWVDITSSTPKKMSITMATSKLTGLKAPEAADALQSVINTGPAEPTYWMITYVADGNYVTSFVVMDIQMTYDVEFFDRNEIDRSTLEGKTIESLYEQIYNIRCESLAEVKKPHNDKLPWNKAKQLCETKESKEFPQGPPSTPVHGSNTSLPERTPARSQSEKGSKSASRLHGYVKVPALVAASMASHSGSDSP